MEVMVIARLMHHYQVFSELLMQLSAQYSQTARCEKRYDSDSMFTKERANLLRQCSVLTQDSFNHFANANDLGAEGVTIRVPRLPPRTIAQPL